MTKRNIQSSDLPSSVVSAVPLTATANGVVGDGSTDDTTALNALIQTALTDARPILINTPSNIKVSNTIDARGTGLVIQRTASQSILQTDLTVPAVLIGDPTGVGNQDLNLAVTYSSQASNAAAVAFYGYYPIQSRYRLNAYNCAKGLALYQGSVATGGINGMFSNQISLEVREFSICGLDTTPYNNDNTGNVWDLVILENDSSQSISDYGLRVVNSDNETFRQLNVGGMTQSTAGGVILVQGGSVVMDSVHLESITFSTYGGSLIVANETALALRGLGVQGSTIEDDFGDNKGLVGVAGSAEVVLDGVYWGNTNTVSASHFGLLNSIDQTGKMWARGVLPAAISAFTAISIADTGQLPVLKQANEQIFHYTNAAGKNVVFKTAAPTTGTWAVGDTAWNTAPAAAGTPGWVCTTAGTPGTWKAMAVLAS